MAEGRSARGSGTRPHSIAFASGSVPLKVFMLCLFRKCFAHAEQERMDSPRGSKLVAKELLSPKSKVSLMYIFFILKMNRLFLQGIESKERRLQMHISSLTELGRINSDLSKMEEQVQEFKNLGRTRNSVNRVPRSLSGSGKNHQELSTSPRRAGVQFLFADLINECVC